MHEFVCGHQECSSQFTSHSKEALMELVKDHLKEVHAVQTPSQTLLGYLDMACVTSTPER